MATRRRLLVSTFTLLALLELLLMPGIALADKPYRENGHLLVPRDAATSYTLTVGEVSVTIPAGAMPKGGPINVRVWTEKNGQTFVQFTPDRDFALPVMIDFGSASVIYYHDGRTVREIVTADLDGDGDLGEIWSLHFSRYSGWF